MKPFSWCFRSVLFIFRSVLNQEAWNVPVAQIQSSCKVLIKERDKNQLAKKTSLLLQSSILVIQFKTEQAERFFASLPLQYFFSTIKINKVRVAIIWAHNKVFVPESDALSSYCLLLYLLMYGTIWSSIE